MEGPTYRVDCKFVGGATLTISEDHKSLAVALDAIKKQIVFLQSEHLANRSGCTFAATIRNMNTVSVTRTDNTKLYNGTGLYCIFYVLEVENGQAHKPRATSQSTHTVSTTGR